MNKEINTELETAIRAMKIADEAMVRAIDSIKQMLNAAMDELKLASHAHGEAIEAALKAREINRKE